MRRSGNVTRSTAAVVLLTLVAGCATARPTEPPRPTSAPFPLPEPGPMRVTVTQPAEGPPPLPSVSVPPRAEAPPAPAPPAPPAPPQRAVPSTAPPVAPAQRGKFIVLNFDNAAIETVIHAASEIVGFNYVLAPDVKGTVTVQTSGRIPHEDVFGVLLAILEVHGFTAVKSGNLYKIVRIEGARERAVPTIVGALPDVNRTTDEIITQIVPMRFVNVGDMSSMLRPLISARGTLIAHRETNVLIVTDTASNVRRLLEVIRLVDVEVALEALEIIPVSYADATAIANILNQLFTTGRLRTPTTPGAPTGIAPPAAPVTPTPAPVPGAAPAARGPAGETTGADRRPLILPEPRSNSLIVHGSRAEIEAIRRLIAQLDVNIYGGRRVFIYYAENAKAKDLAATLNAIYGAKETVSVQPTPGVTGPTGVAPRRAGEPAREPTAAPTAAPGARLSPGTAEVGLAEGEIRFIADETTNSIIVTTTPRNWTDVEATIKQLDKMPRQVLIEVLVAEITLTDDLRLGIDWALKQGSFRFGQQSLTGVTPPVVPPPNIIGAETTAAALSGGLTAFAFEANKFFAILNALAAENRVNVISNPHVLTSENKKAVINVSRSVPIITSQQVPIGGTTTPTLTPSVIGTQSVEYRDAGVILTVTPRIGERGTVAIDVKQEVNDIGAPVEPSFSPEIIKREAETSVVLVNNQTLVLGGLISNRVEAVQRGIPLFHKIPILGYLFGFKSRAVEKRELVLLITPRVVGTALDAARITEQIRRSTPALEDALRNAPRPPTSAPPAMTPPGPAPPPTPAPAAPAPEGVPPIPPAPPPTR